MMKTTTMMTWLLLLTLGLLPTGLFAAERDTASYRNDGHDMTFADKDEKSEEATNDEAEKSSDDDAEEEDDEEKEKDEYLLIKNAVIHTVSQGDLYHHHILAKNGKIIEINTEIDVPEGAEEIDADGFHVYPGLVAVRSGSVLAGRNPGDNTDVFSLQQAIALAGGITTAVSDNTAANLTFGSIDDIVIKSELFERLRYSTNDPGSRRQIRADFEKVRQYLRDLEIYRDKKKTNPDEEEPDKQWLRGKYKKYLSLLKGEKVALFAANQRNDILGVCRFVEQFGLRAVISGAVEGWTCAGEMARAGVGAIVTPRQRSAKNDRSNQPSGSSIENAAILHQHGVRIAVIPGNSSISLWGLAGRDLLQLNMEAAFAVRGGLSEQAALESITLNPARMLGIDHRVGSIEVGKDANFAITDGDMLHYMTHTRWAIVNGRVAYDKQKDTLYSHIRKDGDLDAPPPDDYWPRRLGDGL
ncbi:MAG: amidohydrolase family protein [Phycisphaerae bacterium]